MNYHHLKTYLLNYQGETQIPYKNQKIKKNNNYYYIKLKMIISNDIKQNIDTYPRSTNLYHRSNVVMTRLIF